jgi:hypothetical protein
LLAHEIGHALGLDHHNPNGELTSFEHDLGTDRLQSGDIAGIVALYGAPKTKRPERRRIRCSVALTRNIAQNFAAPGIFRSSLGIA